MLNELHVCLHVNEGVLLYQVAEELDTAIISRNLRLEVSNVVFEVSRASDQWVHIFWLVCQKLGQLNLIEDAIFDDLEAHELGAFLV